METTGLGQTTRVQARRVQATGGPARRAAAARTPSIKTPANRNEGQQVAALCWRHAPQLEVLLITSLRTHRWILPKGWPVAGLTLAQSAAREALEEAGVVGEVAAEPFGRYDYVKEKKTGTTPCTVEIFPLKVTGQRRSWVEKGTREIVWLPAEQAERQVSEPALRRVIREFRKKPRRLIG